MPHSAQRAQHNEHQAERPAGDSAGKNCRDPDARNQEKTAEPPEPINDIEDTRGT